MLPHIRPIHTLNARGNVLLEVVRDRANLDAARMLHEIQGLRQEAEEVLAAKGISYEALRNALIPSQKRKEIALVFDSSVIDDAWYGLHVFKHYMPLFNASSNHSVLVGDYFSMDPSYEPLLAEAFYNAVIPARPLRYRYSGQFFVVYINNLTADMVRHFDEGLRSFRGYVGHADMTYGANFKWLLSNMLMHCFIKHGRIVIQSHEDDLPNTEGINTSSLPFETLGYSCRSLASYIQGPLLSYKIERPVYEDPDVDTEMALNSISADPRPLNGFRIEVDEAKVKYVRNHNASAMACAGLEHISADGLRHIIASKIGASYIYRLEYLPKFGVSKFNVIVEVPAREAKRVVRLVASLEYRPQDQLLKLITLF